MNPDNPVTVHVIHDGDIGKALPVAGLVHADPPEAVHPCLHIRLYAGMGRLDAVPDGTPVDVLELGDGCFGHSADHPCDLVIEIFREAAVTISPGNIFCKNAMLRTFDPIRLVADIYRDAVQIRRTPGGFGIVLSIISRAFLHTDRAEILNPLIRPGMNHNLSLFEFLAKPVDGNCCFLIIGNMHTIVVEI